MTALHTTPPPRLPVRERTKLPERAEGRVSPMLTRLAAERATGVLVRECGTLRLTEGRVVHAESPLAPGLDVLLTAHGTLDADTWRQAVSEAGDRHGAGLLLADSGRLTRGALELCHLGALYDAAYFALAPSSTPGQFRYATAERFHAVRPVPVAALEHETLRRRALLHRIWPDPATDLAPLVRADAVEAPGLTARQQAVLDRVDGVRTAPDIARELGRPAFHTLVDVRRLAAAGVLSPDRAAAGPSAPRHAAGSVPHGRPEPSEAVLPRTEDPDITLLKRLRDALEAL